MGEEQLDIRSNGTKDSAKNKSYVAPVRLFKGLQMNEWTFSFILFTISLSIVLGKLYINYGSILQLQNSVKYVASPTSVFSNISNVYQSQFNVKQLAAMSEKFVNISQYDDVVSVMTLFFKTYGWLIRAAVCGLVMMGFTWFIIYKDSSIPGINPPSPFSPSKRRYSEASGVQMNYMIGVLNGILVFVYMCL